MDPAASAISTALLSNSAEPLPDGRARPLDKPVPDPTITGAVTGRMLGLLFIPALWATLFVEGLAGPSRARSPRIELEPSLVLESPLAVCLL